MRENVVNMKTNPHFDVCVFDKLDTPFGGTRNNYSYFQPLVNRFGVYVIQEKRTGKVLYVGEAHEQNLKERITQNYTEKDTGGSFRNNWLEMEHQDFNGFKALLAECTIKTVLINKKLKKLIISIETSLISALQPKYNKLK